MLLGLLLEDAAGQPLAAQFDAWRDAALPGAELRYGVAPGRRAMTAPTEAEAWRGRVLVGDVHDDNAAALGGAAGHAGLFGTAAAVGAFARWFLGLWLGRVAASAGIPAAMAATFAARGAVPGSSRALGWDTMLPTSSCGSRLSPARHRPHRVHRHVAVDRSRTATLRRAPHQSRPSRQQVGRRHPGAAHRRPRHRRQGLARHESHRPRLGHHRRLLRRLAGRRRAASRAQGGRSVQDYFLTGRQLPWWLAGTSMVATTFAADTPLAVAGLVARNGIAGNWIWWSAAVGSMLTVFFFARLWRRAGILTDVEFAELRYSGRPAAALRGFRALYLGLPINCVIMGWVNLAMAKILSVTLGWDRADGGAGEPRHHRHLRGAVRPVGRRRHRLLAVRVRDGRARSRWPGSSCACRRSAASTAWCGRCPEATLDFVPDLSVRRVGGARRSAARRLSSPIVGVQWWASWYPGQEPGGGGYVAQRMMSARDRARLPARHAVVHHRALLRAAVAVDPRRSGVAGALSRCRRQGSRLRAGDARPPAGPGWRGLLLGAFFAAYMSTISTQLNWGTSYLVNDFYRRFVRADATEAALRVDLAADDARC